jgi:hypothetical protein
MDVLGNDTLRPRDDCLAHSARLLHHDCVGGARNYNDRHAIGAEFFHQLVGAGPWAIRIVFTLDIEKRRGASGPIRFLWEWNPARLPGLPGRWHGNRSTTIEHRYPVQKIRTAGA